MNKFENINYDNVLPYTAEKKTKPADGGATNAASTVQDDATADAIKLAAAEKKIAELELQIA